LRWALRRAGASWRELPRPSPMNRPRRGRTPETRLSAKMIQPHRGWDFSQPIAISPFGAGPGSWARSAAPSGLASPGQRHHQPLRGWASSVAACPQPLRGWPRLLGAIRSPFGAGLSMAASPSAPSGLAPAPGRDPQPLRGWPLHGSVTISPFGAGIAAWTWTAAPSGLGFVGDPPPTAPTGLALPGLTRRARPGSNPSGVALIAQRSPRNVARRGQRPPPGDAGH